MTPMMIERHVVVPLHRNMAALATMPTNPHTTPMAVHVPPACAHPISSETQISPSPHLDAQVVVTPSERHRWRERGG